MLPPTPGKARAKRILLAALTLSLTTSALAATAIVTGRRTSPPPDLRTDFDPVLQLLANFGQRNDAVSSARASAPAEQPSALSLEHPRVSELSPTSRGGNKLVTDRHMKR
jgi:hypothetical protein